jgi:hypothetical protein
MPTRLPNESLHQFAIRVAWEYGHFWTPDNPEGALVAQADLKKLTVKDPVVVKALISLAKMDAKRFTEVSLDTTGRAPEFSGELSPAMESFLVQGRCPVPDHAPPPGVSFHFSDPHLQKVVERMQSNVMLPAIGTGNWKGCWGIGNFHSAIVRVDQSKLPGFLQPVFLEVLRRVQSAYAGVGLLFRFATGGKDLLTGDEIGNSSNTDMSFVSSSDGWIGLAIVGQNETCSSNIWCRFLNTYRGGNSPEDITTQWTTLIKHELGHNCGRGHTNGGVMNPSLVNGLPTEWGSSDPSTNWLKGQFGGVPAPIPGGNPDPKPDDPKPIPDSFQKQLDAIRLENIVQQTTIDWLVRKVRSL